MQRVKVWMVNKIGIKIRENVTRQQKATHLISHGRLHSDVDGLLTRAKMAEASDGLFLVEVGSRGLHSPDGHHLVVIFQSLLSRQSGLGFRTIFQDMQCTWLNREMGFFYRVSKSFVLTRENSTQGFLKCRNFGGLKLKKVWQPCTEGQPQFYVKTYFFGMSCSAF